MPDINMGTFSFEKETPGTYRYSHTNDSGRKETQYIPKSKFEGERPETIEVIVRYA